MQHIRSILAGRHYVPHTLSRASVHDDTPIPTRMTFFYRIAFLLVASVALPVIAWLIALTFIIK